MKKEKKKLLCYGGLLLFLAAAALIIYLGGRRVRLPYADQMEEAARLHREVVAAVKEERLSRGLPVAEEDLLKIGLIGAFSTPITTTNGNLSAKRTSQTPDMAALCVRLLTQAGVTSGDTVGACFSGSFPGLNLAVLCAADVMGVHIIYSSAIGASSYGANLPQYTAPEMILTAVNAGLLSTAPQMITLGGDADSGVNMMGYIFDETEEIEEMLARLEADGIRLTYFADYAEDISAHEALYGDIAAFINVGGNSAGIGYSDTFLNLGQGVLEWAPLTITKESGLVERYLAAGVPTVHLLNLKQLCAEEGVAFDPVTLPEIGTAAVYFTRDYSKAAIAAVGAAAVIGIIGIELTERKRWKS